MQAGRRVALCGDARAAVRSQYLLAIGLTVRAGSIVSRGDPLAALLYAVERL